MAIHRVGKQGAERDALGDLGRGGQHHVGVAAPELRVGNPRRIPAQRLGALDVGGERRDRARVESIEAESRDFHRYSCLDARRAPSTMDANLAHAISGSTWLTERANVAMPQSVPAITRSRPT